MDAGTATNEAAELLVRESAENFLTGFAQALRAFQFYGSGNPAALRALGTARNSCQAIWENRSEIELLVHETTITLGKHTVYESDTRSQSLAFLLYKDGVRALKFLKGFENEDLEEFLLVLHKAKHLRAEEDDLITLLWAADFSKIFYNYIDLGESEEPQLEAPVNGTASFMRALAQGAVDAPAAEQQQQAGTAAHPGSADPAPLPENSHSETNTTELMLAADEMEYLQQELARERQRDVVKEVVEALLDRIEDPEPKIQSEIILILGDLIPSLILQRRLELAADTLHSLREIGDRPDLFDVTHREELRVAMDGVGSSSAMEGVLQALESGDLVTSEAVLNEFLACLGADSLESLLRTRERTTRNDLRVTLDKILTDAAERFPEQLLNLCRSQDPIVACAAIRLLGQQGREQVESHLVKLIRHANSQVRTAVLEVMVLHGGETLLQPMLKALRDENREVRCAAAWGLGTWEYQPALTELEALVTGKELPGAGMNEMRAIFSAYARIGKEQALPTLGTILNKKSLFGGRHAPELRACAARALASMETPEAAKQLNKAKDDKDPAVRRAVLRSLMVGRK